jgi:hypothetical protein
MFLVNVFNGRDLMMVCFKQTLVVYWINTPVSLWLCITGYMKYSWLVDAAGLNHLKNFSAFNILTLAYGTDK